MGLNDHAADPEAPVKAVANGNGQVSGTVDAAVLHHGALGVVLDGVLADTVVPRPGKVSRTKPGWSAFTYALSGMRLARTLDFQSLGDGRRLLPAPLDLAAVTGAAFEDVAFDGVALAGVFRLGWRPHPVLAIMFQDEAGRIVAEGIAAAEPSNLYRFAVSLSHLPVGVLTPVIGGLGIAHCTIEARCRVSGYVDEVEEDCVRGWLANLDADAPARVEARRDGRVVASALADLERPDVANMLPEARLCGFRLALPMIERMRGPGALRIVVAGTDAELVNSPAPIAPLPARLNSFDVAQGALLEGWAIDASLDGPATVEARCNGVVVGRGAADLFREDLRAAGLADGRCMFRIRLGAEHAGLVGQEIEVQAAGHAIAGSPRVLAPNPNEVRFLARRGAVPAPVAPRLRAWLDRLVGQRGLSLVIPVFGPAPADLAAAISSVVAQWCSRWELLCVSDGFSEPLVARTLAQYAQRDARIRIVPSSREAGPGAALAAGFAAARAGHVAVLDQTAVLEPDAVYHLLRSIRDTGADMLFADSFAVEPGAERVAALHARSAFSLDRFLSAPFWPDLLCLRSDTAKALGPLSGAALVLAAAERAAAIAHVPAVSARVRPGAPITALAAVQGYLDRKQGGASVAAGDVAGGLRITWPPARDTLLSVVHGPAPQPELAGQLGRLGCVVHADATPAALNGAVAAHAADAGTVLFIDGGAASSDASWLDRLMSLVARPGVGAAGPMLLGLGGELRAAGLVLAPGGPVPASFGAGVVRDVSALPLAAMAVRRAAFEAAGGFDPALPGWFDADLCLRVAAAGNKILADGTISVAAPLSAPADCGPFAAKHAAMLAGGDPWYSPFLAEDGSAMLRTGVGCRTLHPARIVRPVPPSPPAGVVAADPAPARRRKTRAPAV